MKVILIIGTYTTHNNKLWCRQGVEPEEVDASWGRLKMREMKMRDQFAGVKNAEKVSMESQSVKKCLKVVVFVCRVIPPV